MSKAKAKEKSTEYIKENVRKLSLWHTRTFKPLATHEELDTIMTTLGFVGLTPRNIDGVFYKEYDSHSLGFSSSSSAAAHRPKLPYPRIDGLHLLTYAPFLHAVSFHLHLPNLSDLFHVRGMPLHKVYDRNEKWKRMEDDEYCVFLYRHGTLAHKVHSFSLRKYQNEILEVDNEGFDSMLIHKHETSGPISQIVPLKDIIV